MKSRIMTGMVVCWTICVLLAPACLAATPDCAADPLPRDEMVGGSYSIGPDGEAILTFYGDEGDRPPFAYGKGAATVGVAAGAFVGDYVAAGIQSVAFKFGTDGHLPLNAEVILVVNGREWMNPNLNISAVPGEMVLNNIAFVRSAGWDTSTRKNKDVLWAEALADVDVIGIRVVPKGSEAQTYTISDFMLIGPGGLQIPATLSPLAGRLLKRFNRTTIAAVGAAGDLDADGDGQTALEEAIVGTDDGDAASVFVAEVVETSGDGTTIKWGSAEADAVYNVSRAESLTAGFTLVAGLTLADVTVVDGESIWTDPEATGEGPYFYKVVAVVTE